MRYLILFWIFVLAVVALFNPKSQIQNPKLHLDSLSQRELLAARFAHPHALALFELPPTGRAEELGIIQNHVGNIVHDGVFGAAPRALKSRGGLVERPEAPRANKLVL
jgi:hypothetical protein